MVERFEFFSWVNSLGQINNDLGFEKLRKMYFISFAWSYVSGVKEE